MNRLNRVMALAGGALVAISATACSSAASKPAAAGTTTGTATASGSSAAPSSESPSSGSSSSGSSSSAAPSSVASSSSAGAKPSSAASSRPAVGVPSGFPALCDNAKLDASLAPPIAAQKASVQVIAVKNTGPACTLNSYMPYVWITAGTSGGPEQTRPLVPTGLGGAPMTMAAGQTGYAALDLDPDSAANAVPGYTMLSVTANPTPDTSGKDVQDLKLPAPAKVAKARLGLYVDSPADAIKSEQNAAVTVPEQ